MRKAGLIGGTGPESTLIYYKELNRLVNQKNGGTAFPELAIDSINLYRALEYCKQEKYDELTEYLLNSIRNLAALGADFAALTANTMHIVFNELKERSPLPLVSIVDTVCEEAVNKGYKKIGLLGTIFTMKGEFFKTPFIAHGIEVVIPSDDEMVLVNDRIANELELGIVKEESRCELIDVIEKMKSRGGIEAVILGCTELPLALNSENCPVECLDTMQLHIRKLTSLICD